MCYSLSGSGSIIDGALMSPRTRSLLVIYFSGLIAISIFLLILIWNPIEGSLIVSKKETKIISGPGDTQTIMTDIKNGSISSEIQNNTGIASLLKEEFTELENESRLPEPIINAAELAIPRAQGQQQGL
jgi:hypothetical protein